MGGPLGGGFNAQAYRAQAGSAITLVPNTANVARQIVAATPFPANLFTAPGQSWRIQSGGQYGPGAGKAAVTWEGWFNRQTAGGGVTSTQVFTAPTTFALTGGVTYGVRVDGHNIWAQNAGTNYLYFNTRLTVFGQAAGSIIYDAFAGTNISAGIPLPAENWSFVWVLNTQTTTGDSVQFPYSSVASIDTTTAYRDPTIACGVSEFLNVPRNLQ